MHTKEWPVTETEIQVFQCQSWKVWLACISTIQKRISQHTPKDNTLCLTGRISIKVYCHHIGGAWDTENQERAEVCATLLMQTQFLRVKEDFDM